MTKLITCLAVCGIIAISGCKKGEIKAAEEASRPAPEESSASLIKLTSDAMKIGGIEVDEARNLTMQAEINVPGVVTNTAQGRAVVTPPVAGTVAAIFVKPGDRVTRGQPIVSLQSADLALAASAITEAERDLVVARNLVREADAAVDLGYARLSTAKTSLARQKEFANSGSFSQPNLQAANKELSEAEAELDSAARDLAVHTLQLKRAERLFKLELISRTELEEAQLAVQQDEVRKQKSARQVAIAREAHLRESRIAEKGLMNSKEMNAAEAEVTSANLELRQAEAKRQAAVAAVEGAKKGVSAARSAYAAHSGGNRASGGGVTLVAPIRGVVAHLEVTLGQAVERTNEVCEIENLQNVWVTASIPERDIGKAKRGASARILVKSYPNRSYHGVLQVVGARLDPKTRAMPVEVLVENDGSLRREMFATVLLSFGKAGLAPAIRRSAVLQQGEKNLVYVEVSPGKFQEREVELGRVKGEYVEVQNGVRAGERVATKGAFVLRSEKNKSELKEEE